MPCSNEFSSSWENGISVTQIDVSFKSNFQTEYAIGLIRDKVCVQILTSLILSSSRPKCPKPHAQ